MLIDKFPTKYSKNTEILRLMLESLIRSMSFDTEDGLLLFPRLLDLVESNSELHDTFSEMVIYYCCNNLLEKILFQLFLIILKI